NKPSYINLSTEKSTIYVGDSTTVKVGFNSEATVKDINVESTDTSILQVQEVGDGSIKVKGVKKGTAKIRVRVYNYSWTDGSSSGNLTKTISITVKEKPVTK
ncbi:MAG: hypothetical protein K6E33_06555, partial [Lachnospiraceae bacterium]|nr:hypothetical protein [Lachnospiraceae bacterium]